MSSAQLYCFFAIGWLPRCLGGSATADASTLVQLLREVDDSTRFDPQEYQAAETQRKAAALLRTKENEKEPGPPSGSPLPLLVMYKLTYTKTYGSDHTCLTEVSFQDGERKPMQARLHQMSSCYGCPVHCENCKANWGDPNALFDMVHSDDGLRAWSCTAAGSFVNASGHAQVVFSLKHRPTRVTLRSPDSSGDWVPRNFKLEEEQINGVWETIANIVDAPKANEQSFFVQMLGSYENPEKWPIDYDKCGGWGEAGKLPQMVTVTPENDPPSLSYSLKSASNLFLSNNEQFTFDSNHGMSIDGDFGEFNIRGEVYETRQLTLNFPSMHKVDGRMAEGELHIIVQKKGSHGLFDFAVIAIMLQLDKEGRFAGNGTEEFFINVGAEALPTFGSPKPITAPVDLNVFKEQLDGSIMVPRDCSDYVPWYIMTTPAYVSGSVVKSFKVGPVWSITPQPTLFINSKAFYEQHPPLPVLMVPAGPGAPLVPAGEDGRPIPTANLEAHFGSSGNDSMIKDEAAMPYSSKVLGWLENPTTEDCAYQCFCKMDDAGCDINFHQGRCIHYTFSPGSKTCYLWSNESIDAAANQMNNMHASKMQAAEEEVLSSVDGDVHDAEWATAAASH